jgi:hypothetical protein
MEITLALLGIGALLDRALPATSDKLGGMIMVVKYES